MTFTERKGTILAIHPTTSTTATEREADTREHRQMGRRALIATGGLTALAVGLAEAPLAVNFGRRLLAEEIANLEGIAIDTASGAVDATYTAVNLIVMPIAQALTAISADSLSGLIFVIDNASKLPGVDPTTQQALASLSQILTAWQGNVALFPSTVAALDAVPRDAGKRYLDALKAKQKADAAKV